MTTLALFRISTSLGALLFFAAGFLLARRRQGQRAQAQIPPEPMAVDAKIGRAEQARLTLQRTELEGLLLAAQNELQLISPELDALRREAARLEPARELQNAQLASAHEERSQLQRQLQGTKHDLKVSKEQLDESIQTSRSLDKHGAKLQSELSLVQKRLSESQASHEDYIRLRTQRDENQFLKSELTRLQAQLVDARSGGAMIPKMPAKSATPGPRVDMSKLSLSAALDQTVQALIPAGVGSVVLADEVGFAVTHADEHGSALAAYASLAVSAGDRAHAFAPVGRTKMILIVDEGGAQITIWPFNQGDARLSLVTLSRVPIPTARIAETVQQVTALLERPRAAAQAV